MKKILLLCLMLSALGTGCGVKDTAKVQESSVKVKPVKEPEGDAPWIQAYYDIVAKQTDQQGRFLLIDIDGDGIPELFFQKKSDWEYSKYLIEQAYTCKAGVVSGMVLPKEAAWTSLKLYKDRESGQLVWIADQAYSPEEDKNECECAKMAVDFSDLANIRQTALLEWTETKAENASGKKEVHYFKLPDQTEIPKDQLRKAQKELLNQYRDQMQLRMTGRFPPLSDYDADTNKYTINKDLFYAFARLYDEKNWENYKHRDEQGYMQVTVIDSAFPFKPDAQGELLASVVSENVRMFKNDKLYLSSLAQINLHQDPKVMKTLNEKLKSQVLAALVEGNYTGSFQVWQEPSPYKNFLSVRQDIRYTEKDTGDNKNYYTAAVYHVETGEVAKLSDLAEFDDSMKDKIYAGDFRNSRFTHEECLKQGIYDKLWSLMSNPDLKDHFYIGDGDTGFIIDLAPDDRFCFSIPTDDLADYLH